MDRYVNALRTAQNLVPSEHLGLEKAGEGKGPSEALHRNLVTKFKDINQSLILDSDNLRRISHVAILTISGSLLFLLICLPLILTELVTIAMVSAIFSIACNVITVLVFRREDKIRQSVTLQMNHFSSLYSMIVLYEFCQGITDQDARNKAIAKLVGDWSKQQE